MCNFLAFLNKLDTAEREVIGTVWGEVGGRGEAAVREHVCHVAMAATETPGNRVEVAGCFFGIYSRALQQVLASCMTVGDLPG